MNDNKILKARMIQKHDTKANWDQSTIIPQSGEIIVYDDIPEKIKIGDGRNLVRQLPFFVGSAIESAISSGTIAFSQRHDIEANWNESSVVPENGEIIIYDDVPEKIKIGDGKTHVKDLPFVIADGPGGVAIQNLPPEDKDVLLWVDEDAELVPSEPELPPRPGEDGTYILQVIEGQPFWLRAIDRTERGV